MKAGWQTKTIGEICTLQRGFDLPTQKRRSGAFPLISSSGAIDTHDEGPVRGPGVVTGRSGSIGNVFYVEEDFWPLNTTLYVRDFHGADPRFVYYLLSGFDLKSYAGGTGVPTLNRNDVHCKLAMVPTNVGEQRRIVAILDEAFEGIATSKANAERNLRNARELFDSKLFSLLGPGQGAWPQKTLREVSIDFGRGKSKHRPRNDPKLYSGRYPFIQTGDVRGAEHLIAEYTQTYNDAGLAQSRLWPKGTLCITIAANIAETGVLDFDACFPDSIIGVVVDEAQTSSKYLEYMLHTVKASLKAKGKGSAQDNINLATFENERFPFPCIEVQAAIVSQLDDLSDKVQGLEDVYERKLAALDELKKSLLHQAFSGQL